MSSTPLPLFRRFLAALCACLLPLLTLASTLHSHPHPVPHDSPVPIASLPLQPDSAPETDSDDDAGCGLCQFLHGFQPPASPLIRVILPDLPANPSLIAFSTFPLTSAERIRPPERAPPTSA